MPTEMLAGFFYQINRNIDKGILSDAMYYSEIKLIERAANRRGIPLKKLYEQGSRLIELEKEGKKQAQAQIYPLNIHRRKGL
ncbi:hypothetical protein [Psychrobacillus soli]|uniref:Uncharacterized protein n=1 Tax=Psychrobacillus soli TaxID=1543965 RepID=A0A544TBA7_9BACI|nr:hypothetical protein [Psychrobacillus soli]TQR14762.1 hypothetical protein FG383_10345 [Psychrobacillus soli]